MSDFHRKKWSTVPPVDRGYFKRMARQLLKEEDAVETAPPIEGGDSLDAQVDRYLADYEAQSKTAKQEGFDFHRMTRRLLSEAGEDEEKPAEDGGDDLSGLGGDDAAVAGPSKATLEDIDMEEFCNSVARLIENYDNLLEMRSTLIRRSINFISKSYDQATVDSLEDLLRNKHGLVDGESKQDVEDEQFIAPPADRAGPGGAGA